jgi:hypothetical protein
MGVRLGIYAGKNQESGLSIAKSGVFWTVDPMAAEKERSAALAAVFQVDDGRGRHTVALTVSQRDEGGVPNLTLHCGNSWLSGSAPDRAGTVKAIQNAKVEKGADPEPKAAESLAKAVAASYGAMPASDDCAFMVGGAGYSRYDCPHTRHVAKSLLSATDPEVKKVYTALGANSSDEMLSKMLATWNEAREALNGNAAAKVTMFSAPEPEAKKRTSVPISSLSDEDRILAERRDMEGELRKKGRIFSEFLTLNSVDNPLPVPYGVFGPAGWGKTFAGHMIGAMAGDRGTKLYDDYVAINVQPGAEARDFLGSIMPMVDPKTGEKHFATVDGPLTQAWRMAANGERVLVVVDEVNNLDERAWKMWKSTINPVRGAYPLQTENVILDADGRPAREVITAPQKNLSLYFAGNIGSGFENPLRDPAVPSRIIESYFGPTREQVLAVKEADRDRKSVV